MSNIAEEKNFENKVKKFLNEKGCWYIYKHTSPTNKVYICMTKQIPKKRWSNGNTYRTNNYFYSDIQKYGWDNFKHEVLFENLTKEEACQKEIELIAFYNARDKQYGYNILKGGQTSPALGHTWKLSDETKQKKSNAYKGKGNPFYGKKLSTESRKKISEKLSGENNPFYGKNHSEETRKKISDALKKRKKVV